MKKVVSISFSVLLSMSIIFLFIYINNERNNLKNQKTIVFLISTLNNPFFEELKNGVEEEARSQNINFLVLNSDNNKVTEVQNMRKIIKLNPDVILLNPTSSANASKSVKLANEHNIPIITVDRRSADGEVVTHIASDNVAGSMLAGSYIFEKLKGRGDVVELLGLKNTNVTHDRSLGFETSINNTNINIVAKREADFDKSRAFVAMKYIMQTVDDIDAVFAHNDNMALGALEAIEEDNKDILVVGFDGTEAAIKAINDKRLDATVSQRPKLIGKTAVQIAVDIIDGKKVESFIPIPLMLIEINE